MKIRTKKYYLVNSLLLVFYIFSMIVSPFTHHHFDELKINVKLEKTIKSEHLCDCEHNKILDSMSGADDHDNHFHCSKSFFIADKSLTINKITDVKDFFIKFIVITNDEKPLQNRPVFDHSIKLKSNDFICSLTNVSPPLA